MTQEEFRVRHVGPTEKVDVTEWSRAFVRGDGSMILADTTSGLAAALAIDPAAYRSAAATGDEDALINARMDALNEHAQAVQAIVVEQWREEHPGAELSEDALTALFAPKDEIVAFGAWPTDLPPLILHYTNYSPYTEVERPTGDDNIVWMDGTDELRFLQTLERLGMGELHIKE